MDISDSATKLTKLVNLLGGGTIAIDMKKIVFFDVIVVDQLHAGIVEGKNSGDRQDNLDFIPREGKDGTFKNVDIVEYIVQWKPDEPLYKLLSTKVNDIEKRNTLIVCQVRGSLASWKEDGKNMAIFNLGALFEPLIGKHGLVFVQRPLDLDTTNFVLKEIDNVGGKETTGPPSTELLFEFAGAGLFPVPHAESFTSNCFGPETFAVHFYKKPYVVRTPLTKDLDSLCALDKASWIEALQYPTEVVEKWVQNRSKDILIMEDDNGEVIGAMYTQLVYNEECLDAKPWLETIVDSNRKSIVSDDVSYNPNGVVKQLLRVSTSKGGKGLTNYMPGYTLRDFALNIAASQGISKVYAITRSTDFDIEKEKNINSSVEECYEHFIQMIQKGKRQDRGLNFHLNRGAKLVRKTVGEWIPEDNQNEGFGVLIRYDLESGTGIVQSKDQNTELFVRSDQLQTIEDVCDVVAMTVSKIVHLSLDKINGWTPFNNLGMDSLSLMEMVDTLSVKFSLDLSDTIVFECPSIFDLSYALASRLGIHHQTVKEGEQRSKLGEEFYNNFLPTKLENISSFGVVFKKNYKNKKNEIAIVGIGCRFPGGINTTKELWENVLVKGKSLSGPVPFSRWDVKADSRSIGDTGGRILHGAFVQDLEYFDPGAFKISMAEAKIMDPQHRLILECTYLALLDAGYSKGLAELRGKNVGVFVGISGSDMVEVNLMNKNNKTASVYEAYNAASSSACGRLSFAFNFKGPCVTFDTACSSSLVALHAGMQSLKNKECDLAIVAGVNVMLTPTVLNAYGLAKMTSPTGRCHTFDASADGYLRGEGCAAIVLKSLDAREYDQAPNTSRIHAVLSSVRVAHDGSSASFTAPNLDAQSNLLFETRVESDLLLDNNNIDYYETHGTGTPLGDPVEIEAIISALNREKSQKGTLRQRKNVAFGSVKANIGHLEAAAGLAGLIAAILVLTYEEVPPNAALKKLNPRIQRTIEDSPVTCCFPTNLTSLRELSSKHKKYPLSAAISSFGYSGTIAHAIIRQAPINVRRNIGFNYLEDELKQSNKGVIFLFTGQGSQYPGMGHKLYQENKDYRKAMDRCDGIYKKFNNGESLLENIFALSAEELSNTKIAQPALVSLEWSLAEMWRANNILPNIVLGHSIGEIAAACVAGAMTIETGLHLAIVRGKLMQELPQNNGVMVAVRCNIIDVNTAIASFLDKAELKQVGVASINGPNTIVLAGVRDVVEKVLQNIDKEGIYLQVSHAFHSPLMQEMEDEFRIFTSSLDISSPLSVPMASTVTGEIINVGEKLDVEHWIKQISSTVLFENALLAAMNNDSNEINIDVVVEIGPKPVLSAMAKTWWKPKTGQQVPLWSTSLEGLSSVKINDSVYDVTEHLSRPVSSDNTLDAIFPNRVKIPWVKDAPHPLLQRFMSHYRGVEYQTDFHETLMHLYENYLINGKIIFPCAGMVEVGLAAGAKIITPGSLVGGNEVELLGIEFLLPFEIKTGSKMLCEHHLDGGLKFGKVGPDGRDLTTFATIQHINSAISSGVTLAPLKDWIKSHTQKVPSIIERYNFLAEKGFHRGAFQSINSVWLGEDQTSALGHIVLPTSHKHKHDMFYYFHPALLDGVFQLPQFLLDSSDQEVVWLPSSISRLILHRNYSLDNKEYNSQEIWARVVVKDDGPLIKSYNAEVCDEKDLFMTMENISFSDHEMRLQKPMLYKPKWIQSEAPKNKNKSIEEIKLDSKNIALVYIEGCESLKRDFIEGFGASFLKLSDMEALPVDDIPYFILIPVMDVLCASSSIVLENFLLLIKTLSRRLKENKSTTTRYLYVLTSNTEGPMIINESGNFNNMQENSVVVGGGIWGMVRSASLEISSKLLSIFCIDSDYTLPGADVSKQVLNELQSRDSNKNSPEVSFRGIHRYVRRLSLSNDHILKSIDLDECDIGVAVITGGLGGLGLITAETLLKMGADHVVLVSRSGKVKDYEGQNLQEKLDKLLKLQNGNAISVKRCDMSKEKDVSSFLSSIRKAHGKINTIIHSSGVLCDGQLHKLNAESVRTSFDPKAAGAWWLHKHTYQDKIHNFVVFSSIASLFGNPGQANYSASNSYLDALIRLRRQLNLPGLSIQWPAIADIGMAAAMQNDFQIPRNDMLEIPYVRKVLKQLISSKNIQESPEEAIQAPLLQSLLNIDRFPPHAQSFISSVAKKGPATISKLSTKGLKIMSKPTSTNSGWTKEIVTIEVENAVKQVIGDSTLDHLSNFMDMGVDSLSIIELAKSLQSRFEIEIASTLLFSKPTILDLSEYLHSCFFSNNEECSDQSNKIVTDNNFVTKEMGIFGISCRFPGGVTDLESYWDFISNGKHTSTGIPFDRWDNAAIVSQSGLSVENKCRASHGSFVTGMDSFDHSFFRISKAEVASMCPQQRLVLECAYLAFKDAGYTLEEMKGLNCGVFVGMTQTGNSSIDSNYDKSSVYDVTGTSVSIASGRISYVFDLQGPNSVYDTACSSSLVALNSAVSALQLGECELALVAGVNELFDPRFFISCAIAGMLSPTGRCHTWDASADGYLRGEGCGAILLKPVDKISSGSIYATILGTSVKSDGKSTTITAPNGLAQESLISKTHLISGIGPNDVDYIEAHGTGTSLGDPIEVDALAGVFGNTRNKNNPLMVGSVKANIGHLECAAGIAGLIKAILVLMHETVPPNVGLTKLNPIIEKIIESREFPVKFPTKLESLRTYSAKQDHELLTAGVSSFGYSGTIAHAIIRQAPINVRRNIGFNYLEDELKQSNKGIIFLFTGQGSQYPGMGHKLYQENKDYRKAMDRCDGIYKKFNNGESLLENIFALSAEELSNTKIAQPALVSLEWSLAEMWRANNILPNIVLGHSIGEIAAACVAGAMTIETGLHLAIVRGKLMQELPQNNGVMVAVRCNIIDVNTAIASFLDKAELKQVGVASINGPNTIVLAGVRDVVEKVLQNIDKEGIYLQVSHAFHSPLMQEMEDEFRIFTSSLDISSPLSVPMASTVTGEIINVGEKLDVEHWIKQISSTVLFENALLAAMNNDSNEINIDVVIEIGPKPVLSAMAKTWWKPKTGQQVPLWSTTI